MTCLSSFLQCSHTAPAYSMKNTHGPGRGAQKHQHVPGHTAQIIFHFSCLLWDSWRSVEVKMFCRIMARGSVVSECELLSSGGALTSRISPVITLWWVHHLKCGCLMPPGSNGEINEAEDRTGLFAVPPYIPPESQPPHSLMETNTHNTDTPCIPGQVGVSIVLGLSKSCWVIRWKRLNLDASFSKASVLQHRWAEQVKGQNPAPSSPEHVYPLMLKGKENVYTQQKPRVIKEKRN